MPLCVRLPVLSLVLTLAIQTVAHSAQSRPVERPTRPARPAGIKPGVASGAMEPDTTRRRLRPAPGPHVEPKVNDEAGRTEPVVESETYEVTVYGEADPSDTPRRSLSVREIERLPGIGGDAVKSVQALPGVARPGLADVGTIVVRGSGNYDSRFSLEGIDIPTLFHFGGLKSTYNSAALGTVDLYPGGFGAKFGGAIGGVVELTGRAARRDRWVRSVDMSLLDTSILAEGPIGNEWGLLVTGRRSFAGEVASAVLDEDGDLDLALAPFYWDIVVRLDRSQGARNQLFLTYFAAGDRSEVAFAETDEGSAEVHRDTDSIESRIVFHRAIVGWDHALHSRLRNSLRLGIGYESQIGHVFGDFDYEIRQPSYHLRNELSYDLHPRLGSFLGIDMAWTPIEYEVAATGWPRSSQDPDLADLGVYAGGSWRPSPRLTLTPSLRFDHYVELDETAWSPRLSLHAPVGRAHTLTATMGLYNQTPRPIGHATDPVFGNPDLPVTRARHLTIGDEWRVSEHLSLGFDAYYNRQWDVPSLTDSLSLNFLADGEARMYGIEATLRRDFGERFFGWISCGLSKSERKFPRRPGDPDVLDSAGALEPWDPDRWVAHRFDQPHRLEAVGSWQWGSGISTGLRLQYASGSPMTPNRGYANDEFEFNADNGEYEPVLGRYLSDRFDPHVRIDLRAEKTWLGSHSTWSLYVDIQNASYPVYKSPEGYIYNFDYSKRESYGWLVFPSLGVRVEF